MGGAILLIVIVFLLAAGIWIYQFYNLILTDATKKLTDIKEKMLVEETTTGLNVLFDDLQKINDIKLIHHKVKNTVQEIYQVYKDRYTVIMMKKQY